MDQHDVIIAGVDEATSDLRTQYRSLSKTEDCHRQRENTKEGIRGYHIRGFNKWDISTGWIHTVYCTVFAISEIIFPTCITPKIFDPVIFSLPLNRVDEKDSPKQSWCTLC